MLATTTGARIDGTLGGDGTDMVRATVCIRPVPVEAPADLAGLLVPVEDPRSPHTVIDWRLGAADPDRRADSADIARFWRWRGEFATDFSIGERARLSAFIHWADHHGRASVLPSLLQREARLDTATALRLRREIDLLRDRCEESDEHGLGIFTDAADRWPARAFQPTDPPTTLLALDGTTLTVGPDGLRLRLRRARPADLQLREWTHDGGTVIAGTDEGTVTLTDPTAGMLLSLLARRSPHAQVRKVPLRTVFGIVIAAIHDAATLAGDLHTDLRIHTGAG